jgi:hypothetical protein
MREGKAKLESEIARLTDGLASGIYSVSVMAEIARREREVWEIGDRLLSSEPNSVRSRINELRENALARMRKLREYLAGDTATARAWLTKHVEKIVMKPNGGIYVASGNWNLLGVGHVGVCRGAESNCLRRPFQGRALPVSYLGTQTSLYCMENRAVRKVKTGFVYFIDSSNSFIQSRFFRTSRGLAPSGGPTIPSFSIKSMSRAARP